MPEPYSTAVYPYPAAMWDEAHEHLATRTGWSTVLLTCPDPAECEMMAVNELEARGRTVNALVYVDTFSDSHILRVSSRVYLDPKWDHMSEHFANEGPVVLLVVEGDALTAINDARAAMAERGYTVAVGHSTDPETGMGLLRVERIT